MGPKIKHTLVENLVKQLNAKSTLLEDLKGEVDAYIQTRNEEKIISLKDQIQRKLDECYATINEIAEEKLLEEEDSTAVGVWRRREEDNTAVGVWRRRGRGIRCVRRKYNRN